MKTVSFLFMVILFLMTQFSCSFIPVNNQYEKAGTLKKGNIEISGNATANSVISDDESENVNNNFGFRVGYGLSERFDLKLRYEHLMPTNDNSEDFNGADFISIVPKFALIPNKFSIMLPLSRYSWKDSFNYTVTHESLFSIAPTLLYTFTSKNMKRDLSLGFKTDFLIGSDGEDESGAIIPGITIGAGFSSDLNKWAVRPEIGATFLGVGAFLNYGIGFQFIIPTKKK